VRTWDLVSELPIEIDARRSRARTRSRSPTFHPPTTEVRPARLRPRRVGEDVSYDAEAHGIFRCGPRASRSSGRRLLAATRAARRPRPLARSRFAAERHPLLPALAFESRGATSRWRRRPSRWRTRAGASFDRSGFGVSFGLGDRRRHAYPRARARYGHARQARRYDPRGRAFLRTTLHAPVVCRRGSTSRLLRRTVLDPPADPALYQLIVDAFPVAIVETRVTSP